MTNAPNSRLRPDRRLKRRDLDTRHSSNERLLLREKESQKKSVLGWKNSDARKRNAFGKKPNSKGYEKSLRLLSVFELPKRRRLSE